MGQDMPDVDSSSIKVDGGNQPVFVSSNIEHHEALHPVGAWERRSQLVEVPEYALLDDGIPTTQRALAPGVTFPKFSQGLAGNDVHDKAPWLLDVIIWRASQRRAGTLQSLSSPSVLCPATWQPEEHRRPPSRPLLQSPAMVKWLFASLALLAVLVLAVAVPHGAKAPARPAARGDVVLITIDTL